MRDEYRRHIGRPVMIEIDGNTVGGTLARADRCDVVLTDAQLLAPGREPLPMDGTVVLARASVTWIQVAG